jgi:hypothetical protein
VNPHRLTIVPQFGAAKIEPKTAEADSPALHRMRATRILRSLNKDLKAVSIIESTIYVQLGLRLARRGGSGSKKGKRGRMRAVQRSSFPNVLFEICQAKDALPPGLRLTRFRAEAFGDRNLRPHLMQ